MAPVLMSVVDTMPPASRPDGYVMLSEDCKPDWPVPCHLTGWTPRTSTWSSAPRRTRRTSSIPKLQTAAEPDVDQHNMRLEAVKQCHRQVPNFTGQMRLTPAPESKVPIEEYTLMQIDVEPTIKRKQQNISDGDACPSRPRSGISPTPS